MCCFLENPICKNVTIASMPAPTIPNGTTVSPTPSPTFPPICHSEQYQPNNVVSVPISGGDATTVANHYWESARTPKANLTFKFNCGGSLNPVEKYPTMTIERLMQLRIIWAQNKSKSQPEYGTEGSNPLGYYAGFVGFSVSLCSPYEKLPAFPLINSSSILKPSLGTGFSLKPIYNDLTSGGGERYWYTRFPLQPATEYATEYLTQLDERHRSAQISKLTMTMSHPNALPGDGCRSQPTYPVNQPVCSQGEQLCFCSSHIFHLIYLSRIFTGIFKVIGVGAILNLTNDKVTSAPTPAPFATSSNIESVS